MRNFHTASWRRYAVAFVVVAASLGVIAACNPNKKPAPPPTDPCLGATTGACLTITPDRFHFTSRLQTMTFTVKNTGPDTTAALHTFSGDIFFAIIPGQDNCVTKTLVNGDQCTIGIINGHQPGETAHDTLEVQSENSQPHGVAAELFFP